MTETRKCVAYHAWPRSPEDHLFTFDQIFDTSWQKRFAACWLWVDGAAIGDPQEIEMLGTAIGTLLPFASRTGQRESELLASLQPKDSIELVMGSIYSEDADSIIEAHGRLAKYEFVSSMSPYFVGWQSIVFEHQGKETMIWRFGDDGVVRSASWPIGEIRSVVDAAVAMLESGA